MTDKTIFDVIIIGGGAAGISAALWCDELGLDALLLEADAELGGQLLWTSNAIKNHLGIETADGREMRDIFVRQIEKCGFSIRPQARVSRVNLEKKSVTLATGETFSAQFLIVAAGIRRRKLNVEGEEAFQNKGIIQTGKQNLNVVRGKTAIIVGGGDAAFENALILADSAAKIFLLQRSENLRARKEFVGQVFANRKIEVLTETAVIKFTGNQRLEAVEVKNLKNGATKILRAEAVLIRVGVAPETEIYRGKLALDERGFIEIDSFCQTNVKGVFAVGDIANPVAPTISGAVGMGATAAKAIFANS